MKLDARVIGHLSLMQSMVVSLPDEAAILGFVCQGLKDLPGVKSVLHIQGALPLPLESGDAHFPITANQVSHGWILFTLSDPSSFVVYEDYLKNFCSMLGIILEERRQHIQIERDRAELELRVKERTVELQRSLSELRIKDWYIESSLSGIGTASLDGIVSYGNPQFLKIWGYDSLSEIIGKGIPEFWQDPKKAAEALEMLNTHGKYVGEGVGKRKDGSSFEFQIVGNVVLDPAGQPVSLQGSFLDITDRKRNEKILRAAIDAAEQANRTKDIFLATLSHELRTPLTAILSWAQLIKSRKIDAAKIQKGIEVIEQSALSQSRLINDLLDVSRIASGKLLLDCREHSPAQILHAEIDAISSIAAEKQIQIIQDLDSTVTVIFVDAARLHQILWNLLGNALKFSIRGGKIWVSLRRSDPYVEFVIRDSGKGIPPDFLPHLFDRFAQADSSSTRRFGGLGLGLAISSSLAKMMGGTIRAESAGQGLGATFTVRLPIHKVVNPSQSTDISPPPFERARPANLSTSPPSSEELQRIKNRKILCVDDDATTLEAIKTFLETYGANVGSALSAQQALDIFDEFKPDLVLSDIAMPEMDGYGLLKKIRNLPSQKTHPTPFVALTAYADPNHEKQAFETGFQGYIDKPVDENVLLQTVVRFIT